jgi:hypothetical protein
MIRRRGRCLLWAATALAASLGVGRSAQATPSPTLDVSIQIGGTSSSVTGTVDVNSDGSYSGTFYVKLTTTGPFWNPTTHTSTGDSAHNTYEITVSGGPGATNIPGTSSGANLLDTSTGVINHDTSGAANSVTVTLSGAFTQPTGSVTLQDALSVTSFNDSFPGYDDKISGSASYNNGTQATTPLTSTVLDPWNALTFPLNVGTNTTSAFNNAGSFTLSNAITFNFGGDNGESATAQNTVQLNPTSSGLGDPTPEPSTIALAITGLGTIGLMHLRRRRRAAKAAA